MNRRKKTMESFQLHILYVLCSPFFEHIQPRENVSVVMMNCNLNVFCEINFRKLSLKWMHSKLIEKSSNHFNLTQSLSVWKTQTTRNLVNISKQMPNVWLLKFTLIGLAFLAYILFILCYIFWLIWCLNVNTYWNPIEIKIK